MNSLNVNVTLLALSRAGGEVDFEWCHLNMIKQLEFHDTGSFRFHNLQDRESLKDYGIKIVFDQENGIVKVHSKWHPDVSIYSLKQYQVESEVNIIQDGSTKGVIYGRIQKRVR